MNHDSRDNFDFDRNALSMEEVVEVGVRVKVNGIGVTSGDILELDSYMSGWEFGIGGQ